MKQHNIQIIGLGSMGLGMAKSLVRAGHVVFGGDIDTRQVDALCAAGGRQADENSVKLCDILVLVVLNAIQTHAVLFGEGGLADRLRPGTVIISCATVPPDFARQMETRATDMGLLYLDAPISGGAIKADSGQLSIMASGSGEAFEAAEPALSAMAETVHNLGMTAGTGSAMKSVNQLLAGVHIAAMGEALAFGISQGLDVGQIIDVISKSAGTSWMFENRAPHVRDNDYTPRSTINIWPKDLGIVSEIAQQADLSVPLTNAALSLFKAAAKVGIGQEDDAAIVKLYAKDGNLNLPGDT